jgi:hypothetical protein
MSKEVVYFSGTNSDVIGPTPIEAATNDCREWRLAAARGQEVVAGVRDAH